MISFQAVLDSGELTQGFFGGTGSDNKILTVLDHSAIGGNPHGVAKSDIGLDFVIDTGDGTQYLANDGTYKALPFSDYYLKTEFLGISAGPADAGKPIVLNSQGQIDASMIDASTFYYVAPFTPAAGTEYPDTTGESHGAFWAVQGLGDGVEYTFTGGDLVGLLISDGDFMVWGSGGWSIMRGEMNPTLYYKLDGSQALTAPLAGGTQQLKDIADGTDAQDAVTFAQLDVKLDRSGDTMTGKLIAKGLETDTGSVLRLKNYTAAVDPATEYCSLFYNQQGVPELGIDTPVLSFYPADAADATDPAAKLSFAVYSDGAYHKLLDTRDISNFVRRSGDTMTGPLSLLGSADKSTISIQHSAAHGNGRIRWEMDRGEGLKPITEFWTGSTNPENFGISFNYDISGNNGCSFELKGIEHRVVVSKPDGTPFNVVEDTDLTTKKYTTDTFFPLTGGTISGRVDMEDRLVVVKSIMGNGYTITGEVQASVTFQSDNLIANPDFTQIVTSPDGEWQKMSFKRFLGAGGSTSPVVFDLRAPSHSLVLSESGYIGVGKTPTTILDVAGRIESTALTLMDSTATETGMTMVSTSTHNTRIASKDDKCLIMARDASGSHSHVPIHFYMEAPEGSLVLNTNGTLSFTAAVSSVAKIMHTMQVMSDKLGLGVVNPTERFEVDGRIRANDILISGGSVQDALDDILQRMAAAGI